MSRRNHLKFTEAYVKFSEITNKNGKASAINEDDVEADSKEVKLMKLEKEVDDL
jgi:hypothetical protein